MHNVFSAATPLLLAAGVLLSACGGNSDPGSPAISGSKFSSADDVARAIGGFGRASSAFAGDIEGATGKTLTAKRGMAGKNLRSKATTEAACSGGGKTTSTDDTSTVYLQDGLFVASNCRETETDSGVSTTVTTNGKASDKCTDPSQTADVCNASTLRIADGAGGNTTFDNRFTASGGGVQQDVELKLKGDLTESVNGSTDTVNLSATIEINDRTGKVSATAVFDNLRVVSASAGESYDGGFGFASSKGGCAVGRVSLRTDSTLVTDDDGSITGGQLTVSDSTGVAARVNFNADGSVTVTLPNGQVKSFTEAQIGSLC